MAAIVGLDVGGANTKICCLTVHEGAIIEGTGKTVYHEMWNDPEGLRGVLEGFRKELQLADLQGVALTITAELCDVFASKAQGMGFITVMTQEVFADVPVYLWTISGEFIGSHELKRMAEGAAANWLASAAMLAKSPLLGEESVFLVDMGSTTTDISLIAKGEVMVKGRTDTERLATGELVYTGVLRTPVNAVVDQVFIDGAPCRITSEYFAIMADLYRLLGCIAEDDYAVAVPDNGTRGLEDCARRLARVVGAEPQQLGWDGMYAMAEYIQEKHIQQIGAAIWQILSRTPQPWPTRLIMAGQGTFLLEQVASRFKWEAIPWWNIISFGIDREKYALTAYAVAQLLAKQLKV
ncbi:hydantoinase/oxoprolinase family protein [Sporomusa sphaeroides]|uniref:hydantoinase/oxoprolinase family protein n=1 Tax=Sporomusa sphaeroides TaxID=47679 RepID=UPI00202F7827|nr:hydantoinase/oxoprolinase family protein [Sporomusa sphaeroides]MCM0759205.1 hypothetical protein [Sporomusa sphaeroides DSM 2875]HML35287.1 hydantoinase/oxoprolinase family protein [Sporomusa sphaeroides]